MKMEEYCIMTEIDIAKKAVQEAETAKKLERAKRELKTQTDMMEKRIRQGQESKRSSKTRERTFVENRRAKSGD